MKTITHPIFLILFSVYLLYYLLKISGVAMPEIITSYLADLLSLFIVNTLILWIIRKIKGDNQIELAWQMVFLSLVLFTFFFEVLLPRYNSYYQADILDVLCYTLSAIGFLSWRKQLANKE